MSACTPGHRESCWHARTPKSECTCNCGGENHGAHADALVEPVDMFDLDLQDLETHPDIEAFYSAHEAARYSGESDYGVWWKDDDGGNWRVTYVHETGHVYAICQGGTVSRRARIGGSPVDIVSAGAGAGPVVVMGILQPFPREEEERVRREHWAGVAPPEPAESVLDGWAQKCGQQGSLAWAFNRIRHASEGGARV